MRDLRGGVRFDERRMTGRLRLGLKPKYAPLTSRGFAPLCDDNRRVTTGAVRSTERVPRCSLPCIRQAQLPLTRTNSNCKMDISPAIGRLLNLACKLPLDTQPYQ